MVFEVLKLIVTCVNRRIKKVSRYIPPAYTPAPAAPPHTSASSGCLTYRSTRKHSRSPVPAITHASARAAAANHESTAARSMRWPAGSSGASDRAGSSEEEEDEEDEEADDAADPEEDEAEPDEDDDAADPEEGEAEGKAAGW